MEIVEINKTRMDRAEVTMRIGGAIKRYEFSYSNGGIFVAHFPEEMKRLLRLLPVTVARSIVTKIEASLSSNGITLPFEVEIEKEILLLV